MLYSFSILIHILSFPSFFSVYFVWYDAYLPLPLCVLTDSIWIFLPQRSFGRTVNLGLRCLQQYQPSTRLRTMTMKTLLGMMCALITLTTYLWHTLRICFFTVFSARFFHCLYFFVHCLPLNIFQIKFIFHHFYFFLLYTVFVLLPSQLCWRVEGRQGLV